MPEAERQFPYLSTLTRPEIPPAYLVFNDPADGLFKAKNGATGVIDFSGAVVATVIQDAHDALPSTGGVIELAPDIVSDGVLTITKSNASVIANLMSMDKYFVTQPTPYIPKIVIDSSAAEIDGVLIDGITVGELRFFVNGHPIQEVDVRGVSIFKSGGVYHGLYFLGDGGATSWVNDIRFWHCRLTNQDADGATWGTVTFENGYNLTEIYFEVCDFENDGATETVFFCKGDASATIYLIAPRFILVDAVNEVLFYHAPRTGVVQSGIMAQWLGGRVEGTGTFTILSVPASVAQPHRLVYKISHVHFECYKAVAYTLFNIANTNWSGFLSSLIVTDNSCNGDMTSVSWGTLPTPTASMKLIIKDNAHLPPYNSTRSVMNFWGYTENAVAIGTIGRVFLAPVIVPEKMFVDRIGYTIDAITAGNVRVGIYKDNGSTPVGGALIVESASVAKGGAWTHQEVLIATTLLEPGTYWLAIESDEVATTVVRNSVASYAGASLQACEYDRGGGYGALTNPCPAVAVTFAICCWLRGVVPY